MYFFSLELKQSSLVFPEYTEGFLENCLPEWDPNSIDPWARIGEPLCNVLPGGRAKVSDGRNSEAHLPSCPVPCSVQFTAVEFCCRLLSYLTKLI